VGAGPGNCGINRMPVFHLVLEYPLCFSGAYSGGTPPVCSGQYLYFSNESLRTLYQQSHLCAQGSGRPTLAQRMPRAYSGGLSTNHLSNRAFFLCRPQACRCVMCSVIQEDSVQTRGVFLPYQPGRWLCRSLGGSALSSLVGTCVVPKLRWTPGPHREPLLRQQSVCTRDTKEYVAPAIAL